MTRLLIMGPPGSGKGTQAARIADRLGIPAISTGDIFRANISEGTPLGLEAKRHVDSGGYVPDSVTNAMLRERLDADDATHGFLLDGYPRTVAQVEFLDEVLAEHGAKIDRVIELVVDREETVQRLLARARDEGRTDDSEDVIRKRQQIYAEETAPLLRLYDERKLLIRVDGMGEIDEVADRLAAAIGA
ncbi:MAG TPA: adenylate kinase [Jiangellaceae bacterium]